ncbi:MAG: hypothetical protein IPO72_06245 [Saprospiraceae bacterium]|nr:hypothetical protein [Candidatus Vicinibacter affinis]MBK6572517.1 hypothetical protein [Candidatus Vicinibacter affinis]MBK7304302.1 hypothetical protein [Candidatus Vicinibacter affinis]MBK7694102.1 hypothetical protein [Candidatus Vicinibacter affinis]MBK7798903.1 hypothetical protein [Candidatus Vicinibacter affinis]
MRLFVNRQKQMTVIQRPKSELMVIEVFSNPASDKVTLIPNEEDDVIRQIEIFTMEGRLVRMENGSPVKNKIHIRINFTIKYFKTTSSVLPHLPYLA